MHMQIIPTTTVTVKQGRLDDVDYLATADINDVIMNTARQMFYQELKVRACVHKLTIETTWRQ